MSATTSATSGRRYGLKRVCRLWERSRSALYARRARLQRPARGAGPGRRGPTPALSDTQLLAAIRSDLTRSGTEFPPILLFQDGSQDGSEMHLADGGHRIAAYRRAGRSDIPAEIKPGTAEDALWAALAANKMNTWSLIVLVAARASRSAAADRRRGALVALSHADEVEPKLARTVETRAGRRVVAHCGGFLFIRRRFRPPIVRTTCTISRGAGACGRDSASKYGAFSGAKAG